MRAARKLWWRAAAAAGAGGALLTLTLSAGSVTPAKVTVRNAQLSGNWAGYIDGRQGVTSVAGQWTVPNAGSLPPGVSSTWVGIGGATTTDLIQAGTQEASTPLDSFLAGGAYGAWIEMLPANPVFISGCSTDPACTVRPGDVMKVSIIETGATTNVFTVLMNDVTRGWNYSTQENYQSSNSSGEWIFESPSLAGVLPVPVGNSGKVMFAGANGDALNGSGSFQPISAGGQPVIALPIETAVSALGADGQSFNVCTYALSCPAP
ncbi:MAG TPA: G1 family glutamic endopeptidase [Acidimicrobiales bacterium]|nr:G1 family glutamic endopeptidase [Acidimicrobiales bacterium]